MYVHPENNPGNIEYNASIYVFVKSWFMPTETGAIVSDTWLKIPALKEPALISGYRYTSLNINVETISMMVLTDEGIVIRASDVPPGKQMPIQEFEAIKKDALDIGEWEKTNSMPWPYRKMFDGKAIRERYQQKYGTNQLPFGAVLSDSSVSFNTARAAVMSRPCNCGKK